jgi:hypothetical protein
LPIVVIALLLMLANVLFQRRQARGAAGATERRTTA